MQSPDSTAVPKADSEGTCSASNEAHEQDVLQETVYQVKIAEETVGLTSSSSQLQSDKSEATGCRNPEKATATQLVCQNGSGESQTRPPHPSSPPRPACEQTHVSRAKRQLTFDQRTVVPRSGANSQGDGCFATTVADGNLMGFFSEKRRHASSMFDDELWRSGTVGGGRERDQLLGHNTVLRAMIQPPRIAKPCSNGGYVYLEQDQQTFAHDPYLSSPQILYNSMPFRAEPWQRLCGNSLLAYGHQERQNNAHSAMLPHNAYAASVLSGHKTRDNLYGAAPMIPVVNAPLSAVDDRKLELEYQASFACGMHDFVTPSPDVSAVSRAYGGVGGGRGGSVAGAAHPGGGARCGRPPGEGKSLSTVSLSETDKRKISILTKPGRTRKTSLLSFTMHSEGAEHDHATHGSTRRRAQSDSDAPTSGGDNTPGAPPEAAGDWRDGGQRGGDASSRENRGRATRDNSTTSARCRAVDRGGGGPAERNSAIIHELLTSEHDDAYPVFVVRHNSGDGERESAVITVRQGSAGRHRGARNLPADHCLLTAPDTTSCVIRRKIRQVGPRSQRRARAKSSPAHKSPKTKPRQLGTEAGTGREAGNGSGMSTEGEVEARTASDSGSFESERPTESRPVGCDTHPKASRSRRSDARQTSWSCDAGTRRRAGQRKARDDLRHGRRPGVVGVTPKRSPRLLLKTRLADRPDNHRDDFVYQPLKRKEDAARPARGRGQRPATTRGVPRRDEEEEEGEVQKRRAWRSPGGAVDDAAVLAVLTRSKAKTPDEGTTG